MTLLVLDASAVVAVLSEAGPGPEWIGHLMGDADCFAPTVMPFEVGNVLRKRARGGLLDATAAMVAHQILMTMEIDLWAHGQLGSRAWELRDNCTYNDACFVALAEHLDAPLVTLDLRLTRTPGPRCTFLTPPEE